MPILTLKKTRYNETIKKELLVGINVHVESGVAKQMAKVEDSINKVAALKYLDTSAFENIKDVKSAYNAYKKGKEIYDTGKGMYDLANQIRKGDLITNGTSAIKGGVSAGFEKKQ